MRRVILAWSVALSLVSGLAACGRTDDTCAGLNDCVDSDGASGESSVSENDGGPVQPDSVAPDGGPAAQGADASSDATLDAQPPLDGTPGTDGELDAGRDGLADVGQPDTAPACSATQKLCGSGCVPTSDPSTGCNAPNCTACALSNATATCAADGGPCAIGACTQGFADCNKNPADGCEVNTTTTSNCGACGNACTTAAPYCVAGTGGVYACADNCPTSAPKLCGGTCADLTSDPNHCGTCTNACTTTLANATPSCVSSTCQVNCNTNYTLCSGACVDLQTDNSNCGGCGAAHSCPTVPNASDNCVKGVCTIACNSPLTNCSGTCVNETNDPFNCNGCGNKCTGAGTGATNQCISSVCEVVCNGTLTACGGGNCYDLSSDNSHCGNCTTACAPITTGPATGTDNCVSGSCDPVCNTGYQLCTASGGLSCVPAPDQVHGIFVSSGSGSAAGCGTIGNPCGTINAGLLLVTSSRTIIYVAAGTYPEIVNLPQGVTIEGGWTYAPAAAIPWNNLAQCPTSGTDPSTLVTIKPASANAVIIATNVSATLSTLTIVNATTAAPSQSLYGIFATATTTNVLTLTAVEISIAAGGAGAPGGTGTTLNPPASCSPPSDGHPGAPQAAPTSPTTGGSYGSGGYTPLNGVAGNAGNPGDNGTPGGAGAKATPNTCDTGSQTCVAGAQVTGNSGTNGCGGPGGAAGLGGYGGGASIAIFDWGATVRMTGGTLASSNGGAGGAGGTGAGAPTTWTGMNGVMGGPTNVSTCTSKVVGGELTCLQGTMSEPLGGTAGGTGGAGSAGTAGVSGSGGDSYGYYAGGGGSVVLSGVTPMCGTPGTSPGPVVGVVGSNGAGSCHN